MHVSEYQDIIHKTAIYPKEIGIPYCALGLCGEAGEVAEKVKKLYRDTPLLATQFKSKDITSEGKKEFQASLKKEIGDVIWYCTALANEFGITLEDILHTNYEKLIARRKTNTLNGNGDDREVIYDDGNGY